MGELRRTVIVKRGIAGGSVGASEIACAQTAKKRVSGNPFEIVGIDYGLIAVTRRVATHGPKPYQKRKPSDRRSVIKSPQASSSLAYMRMWIGPDGELALAGGVDVAARVDFSKRPGDPSICD